MELGGQFQFINLKEFRMPIHIVNPCNECGNNKIDVCFSKGQWYGKCTGKDCPERISGGGTEKTILILWNQEHGNIDDFISLERGTSKHKKECPLNHGYISTIPSAKGRKNFTIDIETLIENHITAYQYYKIKLHPAKKRCIIAILLKNEPDSNFKTSLYNQYKQNQKISAVHFDFYYLFKHYGITNWQKGAPIPLTYYKENNYFLVDLTDLLKSQKNPVEFIE